jgi:long-chain acyl-CoA synthetase
MEYVVELTLLSIGMTFGYGRVKTLTDSSVRNCKGDLREFRPSIMIGVPAIWETIKKGVLAQVNQGGTVKKAVFNGSFKIKKNNIPILSQVVDSVVMSKVRAATGGRLRLALSGGAPISSETHEFLNLTVLTVLQGNNTPNVWYMRYLLSRVKVMVSLNPVGCVPFFHPSCCLTETSESPSRVSKSS